MKRTFYILSTLLALSLAFAACSEKEDLVLEDKGTPVKGVALSMGEPMSAVGATTRATVSGYSVNTSADPTSINSTTGSVPARGGDGWELDFTLYNQSGGAKYDEGSFTGGVYISANEYWKNDATDQLYFPNYLNPTADLLLYPESATASVQVGQSTASLLLKQDILEKKEQVVRIAHEIIVTPTNDYIALNHKRAILDFVIADIVPAHIAKEGDLYKVTVKVGSDTYTPYKVNETSSSLEYLLILPEDTDVDPVVEIVTVGTDISQPITYKKPLTIINGGTSELGSNRCYYVTLLGNELELSPITVTDWTTGEPVSGEYVAVTAYPTFKGPADETYYFYYDNRLETETGAPKLQEISFNNEGECTIKPDGRIITHIFKDSPETPTEENKLASPVTLGKMYIDLSATIAGLTP